ncbi:MAG: hypothetical protein KDA96_00635 [Planctomycetaceae bacterium]|nr:hypothetical protein [Planctomycetaceae bacterium]
MNVRAETRILIPFRLGPSCAVDELAPDSLAAVFEKKATGEKEKWRAQTAGGDKIAPSDYYREYLPHVSRFLFGATGKTGCTYLTRGTEFDGKEFSVRLGQSIDPARWVRKEADPSEPTPRGMKLLGVGGNEAVWKTAECGDGHDAAPVTCCFHRDHPLEIWISRTGAGVVSLHLDFAPSSDHPCDTRGFLDHLQQIQHSLVTGQKAVWLTTADGTQPLHLFAFLWEALAPLRVALGGNPEFDLRGLAYTAIQISSTDAVAGTDQSGLRDALTRLALIHEPGFPDTGKLHTRSLMINDSQVGELSMNGAAHCSILPEQCGEYDRNRIDRIQNQYFPGYLLALIQRTCIQRMLGLAWEVSAEDDDDVRNGRLAQLQNQVLHFGLEGEFVQTCWRSTVQQHHDISQVEFGVHKGLETVRHAMNDFARITSERAAIQQQRDAATAAEREHEKKERSERAMHVLEIFVVTVYCVELSHLLADSFGQQHSALLGWSFVLIALLSFFGTATLVTKASARKISKWTLILSLFALTSTIQILFGFVLWLCGENQHSDHSAEARPDGGVVESHQLQSLDSAEHAVSAPPGSSTPEPSTPEPSTAEPAVLYDVAESSRGLKHA